MAAPEHFTVQIDPSGRRCEEPDEFLLTALLDGRLDVVEPMLVRRLREAGQHVLEAPELNEFGFGDNPQEALADLQGAIAELYFTLRAEQGRLGPDLSSVWEMLNRKLRTAEASCCP